VAEAIQAYFVERDMLTTESWKRWVVARKAMLEERRRPKARDAVVEEVAMGRLGLKEEAWPLYDLLVLIPKPRRIVWDSGSVRSRCGCVVATRAVCDLGGAQGFQMLRRPMPHAIVVAIKFR
jgi:hypothetical protein